MCYCTAAKWTLYILFPHYIAVIIKVCKIFVMTGQRRFHYTPRSNSPALSANLNAFLLSRLFSLIVFSLEPTALWRWKVPTNIWSHSVLSACTYNSKPILLHAHTVLHASKWLVQNQLRLRWQKNSESKPPAPLPSPGVDPSSHTSRLPLCV